MFKKSTHTANPNSPINFIWKAITIKAFWSENQKVEKAKATTAPEVRVGVGAEQRKDKFSELAIFDLWRINIYFF